MTSGVPRIPSLRAPAHRPLAYLRLRAADTSAWPIGPARFDIRLTAPDGYKLQSTLATMQITMGATQI